MATDVVNLPAVTYALQRTQGDTLLDVVRAYYLVAERIMGDSKEFYVPVVTGALRDSGRVELPRAMPGGVRITLAYGGASAPYAVAVHEAPPWRGQGKSRYLIEPVYAYLPDIPAMIRDYVRAMR